MRNLARALLLLMATTASAGQTAAAAAGECAIFGETSKTVYEIEGKPFEGMAARRRQPCAGELEVRSGAIQVCRGKTSGGLDCFGMQAGDMRKLETPPVGQDGGYSPLPKIVRLVNELLGFTQSEEVQPAGRRVFDEATDSGFPHGEILLPDGDLIVVPMRDQIGEVLEFRLYDDERSRTALLRLGKSGGAITLPARLLRDGGAYRWTARTARTRNLSGRFRFVAADRKGRILTEVRKALADSPADTFSATLNEAIIYEEFGLEWDRDRVLRRLRPGGGT